MMNEDYIRRLNFIKIVIFIFLAVLFSRLFYLQIIRGKYYDEKAKENMILQFVIRAPRGIIYDRLGRVLVKNEPSFNAYMIPDEMVNYPKTAKAVARALKLKENRIYDLIRKNNYDKSRTIKIKSNMSKEELFAFEEIKRDYPGMYIYEEPIREYLYKNACSHLMGFVGEVNEEEYKRLKPLGYKLGDLVGKQGLEKKYEKYLRGSDGAKLMQVDSTGRIVKPLGEVLPKAGDNLFLNIDLDLQLKAHKSVVNKINSLKARGIYNVGAAALCLDAKTGAVLALVSYPDYDANLFVKGMTQKQYKALILDNFFPLLNRVTSTAFPCASTFKIVTGTAALEENLVKKDTLLNCPGYYNVGEVRFNCFKRAGHANINFLEAIAHSCDVVFYRLGLAAGLPKILKYAENYGLGSLTGIDLDEEIKGLLPDQSWKKENLSEDWYPGDTVNLSIGQGYLQTTPLQVAYMTSVLANDGERLKPFIVNKITSCDANLVKEFTPQKTSENFFPAKKENYEIIKEGMGLVTSIGTASGLTIKGFKIAGKTGTVENLPTEINPYGRNHAWFTCFAPCDADKSPEIIVTVFFEQSGDFGGDVAAPVAYDIVKCYYEKYHKKGVRYK